MPQTSTAKLPAFFQRLQTTKRTLNVNDAKITNENAFNGDHFKSEGNHEYRNNGKTFFCGIFADL